jgi:chaperonin GroEL
VPPQFGYKRDEIMNDIAIATGGMFISDNIGDNLELMTIDALGQADKVIIGKDSTVIMLKEGEMASARIGEIKDIEATTKEEVDFKQERIANLSGGIAVIYVGATSDIEQKEKRDRVDDAVCATKAALEEGILPGGGYALLKIALEKDNDSPLAETILKMAISSPFIQILNNAGIVSLDEVAKIAARFKETGHGYNVKTGEIGDLIKMGVVDPLKVTKSALDNAVSVSTTILSTRCIIYNARIK